LEFGSDFWLRVCCIQYVCIIKHVSVVSDTRFGGEASSLFLEVREEAVDKENILWIAVFGGGGLVDILRKSPALSQVERDRVEGIMAMKQICLDFKPKEKALESWNIPRSEGLNDG